MDLKDMIVKVVYLSPEGLLPVEITEKVNSQFGVNTTTKKVLQVIKSNPKLFLEEQGKIKNPPFGENR